MSNALEEATHCDDAVFAALIAPYRGELHRHCYRMLGSLADADDAVQDTLVGAWRGLAGFEGRSSLRTWLFRIATHACLAITAKRKPRRDATEHAAPSTKLDADPPILEPIWLEPYAESPHAQVERVEHVELAFIAALQHLPATQRAVVLARDVLEFSADETAALLETTVASANSALQRARETLAKRAPARSQATELRALGDDGQRALVADFIAAWERRDVDALVVLLARDVRFTMPPVPTWFDGIATVTRFFAERVFTRCWRLSPLRVNGQLGVAAYQWGLPAERPPTCDGAPIRDGEDVFRLSAIDVITVRDGLITEVSGFLDPSVHARFAIPQQFVPGDR